MITSNHKLGILLSVCGYTAWVAGDALIKLAGETIPILQILTVSFLVGMLFLLVVAGLHGGYRQVASKRPLYQIICSILVMGASYGSVAGVIYLSLTDFYTIIFTSPLIMTILASLFLKEKVHFKMWLAIIFGFLGVIVAVRFSGELGRQLSPIGVAATCLASLTLSLSMLAVRAAHDENNYALSFWPRLLNFIAGTILMQCLGVVPIWNRIGLLYAVLAGVTGVVGALLTNLSLRFAPVAIVAPYHYTQIVGGAFLGYLIWHHIPLGSVIVGAFMISAAGLYILRYPKMLVTDHPL